MSSNAASGQKQQRARQQLSCTACRTGKLKCNRQHPCDQCTKRSKDHECHYLPPPAKKRQNKNTKDRIAQLEGLVVQLMNRVSRLSRTVIRYTLLRYGSDDEPGSINRSSAFNVFVRTYRADIPVSCRAETAQVHPVLKMEHRFGRGTHGHQKM